MKKKIFSLLIIVNLTLFAQNAVPDSSYNNEQRLNFSNFFNPTIYLNDPYFSTELNSLGLNTNFLSDSTSILMQTRMQLAWLSNSNQIDAKTNLLNPLYKNYMAGQTNRLFSQILGAVQVGAVGFLAYKHIEKYYIKKKK